MSDVLRSFTRLRDKLGAEAGIGFNISKFRILAATPLSESDKQLLREAGLPPPVPLITFAKLPVSLDPQLVTEYLSDRVRRHSPYFESLKEVENIQARYALLRYTAAARFGYLARAMPPDLAMRPLQDAQRMIDEAVAVMLELGGTDIPHDHLELIRLPIRLGGFGVGDLSVTSNCGYVSSRGQAAAHCHSLRVSSADSNTAANAFLLKALKTIIDMGADCDSTKGIIPESGSVPEFLRACEALPSTKGMQKLLTKVIQNDRHHRLLERAPPHMSAIMEATRVVGSGRLLTMRPSPQFQVPSSQFAMSLRQRAALPLIVATHFRFGVQQQQGMLATARCRMCAGGLSEDVRGGQHFMTCPSVCTSQSGQKRIEMMAKEIRETMTSVGAACIVHPPETQRDALTVLIEIDDNFKLEVAVTSAHRTRNDMMAPEGHRPDALGKVKQLESDIVERHHHPLVLEVNGFISEVSKTTCEGLTAIAVAHGVYHSVSAQHLQNRLACALSRGCYAMVRSAFREWTTNNQLMSARLSIEHRRQQLFAVINDNIRNQIAL